MLEKALKYCRRIASRRYSILLVPHHLSGAKTFTLSLPLVAVFLGLWSLVTVAGVGACVKGGEFLAYLAETKLLKTQLQVAAREVGAMREMAQGVAMLEKDLRYLLGQEDLAKLSQAAAGFSDRRVRKDTLGDLMMGRISQKSIEGLREERVQLRQNSEHLMAWAGNFLLDRQNAARQFSAQPSEWPAVGVLTSGFGIRLSPFHQGGAGEAHRGVDIANAAGTPVRAAADGVVRKAGWMTGYGRTVVLDHGFGYSSLYGHTSEILVAEGSQVRRGDTIAYMGTTGRSTGNHLHFEVWQHGRPINPFQLVRLQKLVEARESYAKSPPVEPQDAVNVLGIGVGGDQ